MWTKAPFSHSALGAVIVIIREPSFEALLSTPDTKMNKRRPLWIHFKSSFYLFALIPDKENENFFKHQEKHFWLTTKTESKKRKDVTVTQTINGRFVGQLISNIFVYVIHLRSSNFFLFWSTKRNCYQLSWEWEIISNAQWKERNFPSCRQVKLYQL